MPTAGHPPIVGDFSEDSVRGSRVGIEITDRGSSGIELDYILGLNGRGDKHATTTTTPTTTISGVHTTHTTGLGTTLLCKQIHRDSTAGLVELDVLLDEDECSGTGVGGEHVVRNREAVCQHRRDLLEQGQLKLVDRTDLQDEICIMSDG
jgi:hypothetical protein